MRVIRMAEVLHAARPRHPCAACNTDPFRCLGRQLPALCYDNLNGNETCGVIYEIGIFQDGCVQNWRGFRFLKRAICSLKHADLMRSCRVSLSGAEGEPCPRTYVKHQRHGEACAAFGKAGCGDGSVGKIFQAKTVSFRAGDAPIALLTYYSRVLAGQLYTWEQDLRNTFLPAFAVLRKFISLRTRLVPFGVSGAALRSFSQTSELVARRYWTTRECQIQAVNSCCAKHTCVEADPQHSLGPTLHPLPS